MQIVKIIRNNIIHAGTLLGFIYEACADLIVECAYAKMGTFIFIKIVFDWGS